MGIYEELLKKKNSGYELNIDDLLVDDLKKLFIEESKTDAMIAELFDVKPSRVTYLRRKDGITIRNEIIENILNNNDYTNDMNNEIKLDMLTQENITKISKALTHFLFRNGPIEDMHSNIDKNITDEDMKKLNKFMVNRLAYVFTLIKNDEWMEFNFLIEQIDFMFGSAWDDAIPEDGGNRECFIKSINQYSN